MSEIGAAERLPLTGEAFLAELEGLRGISDAIRAQDMAIEEASMPIRASISVLAVANFVSGKDFSMEDLSLKVREAIAKRAELSARRDYLMAKRDLVRAATEARLLAELCPEGSLPAKLSVIPKEQVFGHSPISDVGGGRVIDNTITGIFSRLNFDATFYLTSRRTVYQVDPFNRLAEDEPTRVAVTVDYPPAN